MIRPQSAIIIAVLGILVGACHAPTDPDPQPLTLPRDLNSKELELIASADQFGLELFREVVHRQPDENVFISPLSVSMALGMTANGAADTTLEAMRSTLALDDLTEEESNSAYQSLIALLTTVDPLVQFDVANSIWTRLGLVVDQDFLQRCAEFFAAVVEEVDFSDPATADLINAWVEENTNGKIDQIVSPGDIGAALMVLANAIYFKGTWTYEFDPEDTRDDMFTTADGSAVPCRMMNLETDLLYYANEDFQAVDLPYGDGYFSMTVLLPRTGLRVDSLAARLTTENWSQWTAAFDSAEVHLQLPKFKLGYLLKLNDVLKALGMSVAFDGGADFTRMIPSGAFISEVRHKTFVQVDEEGTEAAAVTVVIMRDSAGAGNTMRVDRPFIFVIRERTSGALLFMGRIVEPVWEG
jgi:serpin B